MYVYMRVQWYCLWRAHLYARTYLHQFCPDWLYVLIQEVRLEVVHTQLQRAQTLEDRKEQMKEACT